MPAQLALAVDAARGDRDRPDFTRWFLLQCHHDLHGGAAEAQHVGRSYAVAHPSDPLFYGTYDIVLSFA